MKMLHRSTLSWCALAALIFIRIFGCIHLSGLSGKIHKIRRVFTLPRALEQRIRLVRFCSSVPALKLQLNRLSGNKKLHLLSKFISARTEPARLVQSWHQTGTYKKQSARQHHFYSAVICSARLRSNCIFEPKNSISNKSLPLLWLNCASSK